MGHGQLQLIHRHLRPRYSLDKVVTNAFAGAPDGHVKPAAARPVGRSPLVELDKVATKMTGCRAGQAAQAGMAGWQ